MREIIISTESGSDMPKNLVDKYGVYVIPMHVIMDDKSYPDGEIPVDMVFDYFKSTGKVPTTSAVNDFEYTEFFNKIRAEHPDCVIYHVAYTSQASSTYQSANIAIKEFEDIYLLDSKSVSGGCTAYIASVYEEIQARKDSLNTKEDYDKLFNDLQAMADKVACHFIPNTLEYLKAGGRVSNAKFLLASALNLKPLIEMVSGKLVTTKKYRGEIIRWVEKFFDDFLSKYKVKKECLYLMYGKGLPQKVLDKMAELAKKHGFKHFEYVMTGCVISCHGGEGAIGLAGVEA